MGTVEIERVAARSLDQQQLKEIQRLLLELHGLGKHVIDAGFIGLSPDQRITKARARQGAIRSKPKGPKVCQHCDTREELQRHHLIPTRFGGRNVRDNLMWLCIRCHKKVHGG